MAQAQDTRSLRHAFDKKHAGHHRVVGKVTKEMRFVEGNVFNADAMVLAADTDDSINHDKGIAMRQQPQYFANVGDLEALAAHSSVPSALRPRRTRRRMLATPRFHSITGSGRGIG